MIQKQKHSHTAKHRQTSSMSKLAKTTLPKESVYKPFLIVGIGGSAGGLEAFEEFFKKMPSDSGMAFVIVTHLDPTQKGMLPELLQRATSMKVLQAEDGMKVRPNTVYVIPSNKDITIIHGVLQLFELSSPRGLNMPIDYFLRSLAIDRQERAACIIFSGMGSDGLGLAAIKEKMGMVMVQSPRTAKYDSMPLNAVNSGLADYILPVDEMPAKLISFEKNIIDTEGQKTISLRNESINELQKILMLLRSHTGHDFSFYKRNTIYRRIDRRIEVNEIKNIAAYVRYLQTNPKEIDLLFKELLIGVTNFFRDPMAFKALGQAIVSLLKTKSENDIFRVWVPGCSTGEEAYSIAIVIKESFATANRNCRVQIFASDIDQESIDKARTGIYSANIGVDVSRGRLERFFILKNDQYHVKKEIREMVAFAMQNIIKDPPFTRLDLLSCRNLLIYMTPELQKKIIPLFHYALKPGGILFLGNAENIGDYVDIFAQINVKWKLFKRRNTVSAVPMIASNLLESLPYNRSIKNHNESEPEKKLTIAEIAQRLLLDKYTPSSVIINEKGDILYINGHTGKYLEPSPGKPVLNIFEMAREGLRLELSSAVYKASSENRVVIYKNLRIKTNGAYQSVDITVEKIKEPEHLRGLLMVVFHDSNYVREINHYKIKSSVSDKKNNLAGDLDKELKYTKDRLRKIRVDMENSMEELKSTNEELQSTNEELQSTNEELMTSKEEMQSLNEELITVNNEYQVKIGELSQINNDMKNLLDSTEIATLFLDNNLRIKRFTPRVNKIINLLPSDIGRPLTDITLNIKYDNLISDSREVLAKLVPREFQVQSLTGKWYIVRIIPYRTIDNYIDGIVITFNDITSLKTLEGYLKTTRRYAENIVDTVREPLVILGKDLKVISANRSFYAVFKVSPEQVQGHPLYELGSGDWNIPKLRSMLQKVADKNKSFSDYIVEHTFRTIGHRKMLLNARRIKGEDAALDMILLAIEDVTKRK